MVGSVALACAPPGASRADLLARLGWEVEQAEDGYRAVELAQRTKPEVALLPTDLPGLPPVELAAKLRAAEPDMKLLFELHDGSGELAGELLRAGADGVLDPGQPEEEVATALAQVGRGGTTLGPGVARDLAGRFGETVHRELEWSRTLADLARQAEELASTKAEFLSNLSHELRTPLTVIKGVAQVVGRFGDGDEQQKNMLGQLEEAATKLTRMVENLLVLAEMERGEFTLEIEDCNLAEIVRAGAEEGAARYAGVELSMMVPQTIPAKADAERIHEVVRHLVDNACRYSEDGDTVTVQAKRAAEGVIVTVTDRGRGVDRKVVSAAFGQAFSPGEEVLTKDRAGLGLGLNLARNLVAQHGGILSAEPLPGGGSKVSFVLPPEPQVTPQQEEQDDIAAPDDDPLEALRSLQRKLADSEARAAN
ncbi:MAG TPA: ATP-binding protein [Actinomycetota bacterium]|nr:ATP-binding protein [Actinomycetota bacterium]